MSVQATLFGEWAHIREWGRIGQGGQVRAILYPTMAQAQAALDKVTAAKVKRGYCPAGADR
jgi:predicted DNA-binding WGR domain protein